MHCTIKYPLLLVSKKSWIMIRDALKKDEAKEYEKITPIRVTQTNALTCYSYSRSQIGKEVTDVRDHWKTMWLQLQVKKEDINKITCMPKNSCEFRYKKKCELKEKASLLMNKERNEVRSLRGRKTVRTWTSNEYKWLFKGIQSWKKTWSTLTDTYKLSFVTTYTWKK